MQEIIINKDKQNTKTIAIIENGILVEQYIEKEEKERLEGNVYLVSPYLGDFTPAASQPNLLKKTQEISFKKGVGLVKEICHSVYGKGFFETRLVSATVVN